MKIQRIVNLCKRRGLVAVFEDDGATQWIGDGASLYPMYGLPYFDQDSFCKTYDISNKQQDKMAFRYQKGLPEKIDCTDMAPGEIRTGRAGLADISMSDGIYTPCVTQRGIVFFNRDYLYPLMDEPLGLDIYERKSADGETYFAIKSGFMLKAIVLPVKIITRQFVDGLCTLAQYCKETLERQEKRNAEVEAWQMNLYENEETNGQAESNAAKKEAEQDGQSGV